MRYLLDVFYFLALLVAWPVLRRRKYRGDLWNRFLGRTGVHSRSRKRIWFHGVSLGEIHLLHKLIEQFRRRYPGASIVVSSTTDTGLTEAGRLFPNDTVIRWPLDFSWSVWRALGEVRPSLIVLAESEWWPNMLLAAKRRGIPVVAVNVRLSPRAANRYRRWRSLASRWLGLIQHFAVQTRDYARTLADAGVPMERITITGNLKYDGVQTNRENVRTRAMGSLFGIQQDEIVWVAGSTQWPEEETVMSTYRDLIREHPNLRLIIVPRQPDQFDPVARFLDRTGLPYVRRSNLTTIPSSAGTVVLVDSIGELGAVWGLADIAFVGGSLDGKRGGQNMIEPAAYGAAVVFGPHTWNFRDTVQRLLDAKSAVQVEDDADLEATMRRLLADAGERRRLGDAARRLVLDQQGATERSITCLHPWLSPMPESRAA